MSTTAARPIPVLVCGAGPTGLTVALLLAQQGVECRIIDRRTSRSGLSRATGVNARALELLDQLGVAEDLLERGFPLTRNSYLRERDLLGIDDIAPVDSDMPALLSVSEAEVERGLEARLASCGVQVERGTAALTTAPDGRGPVTLTSPNGGAETVEARWVVDAEGAHSALRAALGISLVGPDAPGLWAAVDVKLDSWPFDAGDTPNWLDAQAFWAQPLPGGNIRVFFGQDSTAISAADVQRELDRRFPEPAEVLSLEEAQPFALGHRVASTFRRGHVFLAGDAAHQCSPIGGRGMNLGIQDAFNLGWKLAAAADDERFAGLLDSYDPERRPVVTDAVRTVEARFATLTTGGGTGGGTAAEGAAAGLAAGGSDPRTANNRSRDVATVYRDSPIIDYRDPRIEPGVVPGARVPEMRLDASAAGASLRRRMGGGGRGPQHLVVRVGEPSRDVGTMGGVAGPIERSAHVDALPLVDWLDVYQPSAQLLAALGPGLFAIRPDGVLGFAGQRGEDARLAEYLRRLGFAVG